MPYKASKRRRKAQRPLKLLHSKSSPRAVALEASKPSDGECSIMNIASRSDDGLGIWNCGCRTQIRLSPSFQCYFCGFWCHAPCSGLQQADLDLLTHKKESTKFCCASCVQEPDVDLDAGESMEIIVSLERRTSTELLRDIRKSRALKRNSKSHPLRGGDELKSHTSPQAVDDVACKPHPLIRLNDQDVKKRANNVDVLLEGELPESVDLGRLKNSRFATLLR